MIAFAQILTELADFQNWALKDLSPYLPYVEACGFPGRLRNASSHWSWCEWRVPKLLRHEAGSYLAT